MERLLTTDALVLRARNFKETDQILTLYTEKAGKLSAIVKGVKKPKSRLRGGVQVFSHTNLTLYLGAGLATVTQAETINTFALLREDLTRMTYASYLAELIDSFTPSGEKDDQTFKLALMGNYLLTIEEPWLVARVVEIRLLTQLGYQPQLDQCAICGKNRTLNTGEYRFAVSLGGLVCPNCAVARESINDLKISGEALELLKRLLKMDLIHINRLQISQGVAREIEELLDFHITHNLGRKIKSKEFLNILA